MTASRLSLTRLIPVLLLALIGCGQGGGSNPSGPAGAAPPPPTGVTATPGNGQVTIRWNITQGTQGATSYNLYMASHPGVTRSNYDMKHTGAPNPFPHLGLTNGTTYYFVVTGLNGLDEGAESAEVSATPSVPPG